MGRAFGCLFLLAFLAWFALEIIVFAAVSGWMNRHWETYIGSGGWFICLGWTVLTVILGIKLARWHLTRVMSGILTGTAGRHLIGVAGAVLLALPGLLSDIPGLLLLLPPVQRALGRLGGAVMASVMKRTMGKMMAGGMGPGGFGGMAGMAGMMGAGPFPGMQPMKPDEMARFPKRPKTIDTTVEKD